MIFELFALLAVAVGMVLGFAAVMAIEFIRERLKRRRLRRS